MKTLQDLVDSLNATANSIGEFSVSKDFEDDFYLFCDYGDKTRIICFDTESGEAYREGGFSLLKWEEIRLISDYVTNHGKNDWFKKKGYNIVIAKDSDNLASTAYFKDAGEFTVSDMVQDYLLSEDKFVFNESEIEELKSTLPENMRKIVDLGKVKVD